MKEFTERHHAFLVAKFYKRLTEAFGDRGEQAFIHATHKYAEQRGSRMAQRAIRDGRELNFVTYREYGEWTNTKTAIEEMGGNKSDMISFSPDFEEHVTQCPWASQFADMDMKAAGTVYCTHVDKAIARGFNPYLVFDVPQSMHEHGYCIQILRDANFEEGQTFVKKPENRKEFDYHCGHCYYTYSEIVTAVFSSEGASLAIAVLEDFASEYGRDMADRLTVFRDTNFNVI